MRRQPLEVTVVYSLVVLPLVLSNYLYEEHISPPSNPATVESAARAADGHPVVSWNDNLESAGTLKDGVLELDLDVVSADWHLLGPDEPAGVVYAFREVGQDPSVPGPMIRVPQGSQVSVTLRNPLDVELEVHGLSERRVETLEPVVVPPGSTRTVRFVADAEGTYYYWGTTTGSAFDDRFYEDSQLSGALIVDPATGPAHDDRVLVMGIWFDGVRDDGSPDNDREFLVINGRPWPLTERLEYELSDSIRWRLINASTAPHPMHLHGFYFRVDSRGDVARDTIYWPGQRREAVTERMSAGTTMAMVWAPNRPGGWIFHCHLTFHVVPNPTMRPERPTGSEILAGRLFGHHDMDPNHHVEEGMGGLMMAMFVHPPEGWEPNEPKRREMSLFVNSDSVAAPEDADPLAFVAPYRRRFAYVLQEGPTPPAPDSLVLPGSPLILWKGEPTAIRIFNQTHEATQIHWHGLEIESYYDGVTGVGGYPDRPTPAIPAEGSFEMRFTPPRAGSFMYHTHMDDVRQQGAGLYGAFIVLDEGEEWDPEHDRPLVIGWNTSGPSLIQLNGSPAPEATTMNVGETYRLRWMNITLANPGLRVSLTRDGSPVRWTPIAKDGADLPPHQRTRVLADQTLSIGEIMDVEVRPTRPGEMTLEVRSGNGRLIVSQTVQVIG